MSYKYKLYGAILGDLAGQPYEFEYKGDYSEFNIHDPNAHITDDSVMTLATAAYLLGMFGSFEDAYKAIGNAYPDAGYGKGFKEWLNTPIGTSNNSWANGCLMRLSPLMYVSDTQTVRELVVESCMNSHNHPKSIISSLDLHHLYLEAGLRKHTEKYKPEQHVKKFEKFDVSAEGTIDFIENAYWLCNSTTEAIGRSITYGGDTDTNASILGELMNYTFHDLTEADIKYVESKLDPYLLGILHEFNKEFI